MLICVIGAGASGLTSVKSCLESGFVVTCYEKASFIGGLWKYQDANEEGVASVMKSTIANSSKEISSFSDFIPDSSFPNYMHNTKMVQYLEDYADHYDLKRHIEHFTEVVSVSRNPDYEETGKWIVKVKNTKLNEISETIFDGVMICTGHHVTPLVPALKGQELFKGLILHSNNYKKPTADFADKSVLVIGVGNSGGDAACELSNIADKVYLSSRRGLWVNHRLGVNGWPFDTLNMTRFWMGLIQSFPALGTWMWERCLNRKFDHELYSIKPGHRVTDQEVMINDDLPHKLLTESILMKNGIVQLTENGVMFKGEDNETLIDVIILATGYLISFPFLENGIVELDLKKNEVLNLFKYVFPAQLKHASLAFIGLVQPAGALFPICESQARWYCQLMGGNVSLPSMKDMMDDIARTKKERERNYYEVERHTIKVDWLPYMDDINSMIGAKPDLFHFLIHDFTLWIRLLFGPCIPAQYRLQGPHSWIGAREAIMNSEERIRAPLNTRGFPIKVRSYSAHLFFCIKLIFYVLVPLGVLYKFWN